MKVRLAEVCTSEVCSLEFRLAEVRTFEDRFLEVRTFEVTLFEVCPFEVRRLQVRPFEVRPYQVRPSKIGFGKIGLGKARTNEICTIDHLSRYLHTCQTFDYDCIVFFFESEPQEKIKIPITPLTLKTFKKFTQGDFRRPSDGAASRRYQPACVKGRD